ncbi:MAG: substrate-binding domain-containing protein [Pseudonocardia sp.]|nr:substrate-binding domain-containing protein [Pseudonocardia sp.]
MSRFGAVALLGLALGLALSGCASTAAQSIHVGVLLPSDDAGPRWNEADNPLLENQFKGMDYAFDPDIENVSAPDEATTAATKMIDDGSKVLVFATANRDVATAITTTARKRGIPTVGYGPTGSGDDAGPADVVVATDYRKVGELAGRALVRGLRDKNGATVIQLDSGPTRDAAARIAEGEHNILAPHYHKQMYRLVATAQVNPADGRAVTATLTRMLDAHGGRVDAVLTASDAVAQAAIAVLRQRGLAGKTTVTGYGATPEALKAMLRGEQFMTGYTTPEAQATAAATVAKALATGDQATVDRLAPARQGGQPRLALVAPTAVALGGIDEVFNSGTVESADVCDNTLALRCNQLSIS